MRPVKPHERSVARWASDERTCDIHGRHLCGQSHDQTIRVLIMSARVTNTYQMMKFGQGLTNVAAQLLGLSKALREPCRQPRSVWRDREERGTDDLYSQGCDCERVRARNDSPHAMWTIRQPNFGPQVALKLYATARSAQATRRPSRASEPKPCHTSSRCRWRAAHGAVAMKVRSVSA